MDAGLHFQGLAYEEPPRFTDPVISIAGTQNGTETSNSLLTRNRWVHSSRWQADQSRDFGGRDPPVGAAIGCAC